MIKIILVDDSFVFREIIASLISQDDEIEVIGYASNGNEAFDMCLIKKPDVILMDIRMPECNGIEGTRLIKENYPDIKIIILTTFEDDEYITEALKFGAEGYVLKDSGQNHIRTVIKSVMNGYPVFHQKALGKMVQSIGGNNEVKPVISLNDTEREILKYVIEGKSNREIGCLLCLSEGRIKTIIRDLFDKTNTSDRTQLAVYTIKNDILE